MNRDIGYWKYGWQKWMTLLAAILFFIVIFMQVAEYQDIANVKDEIFSTEAWETYVSNKVLTLSLYSLLGLLNLSSFLIGSFSSSMKMVHKLDTVVFLLLAIAWLIAGLLLPVKPGAGIILWWALQLTLVWGVISSYQNFKKE